VFTVGESGQVGIDYLFDGGSYKGELGIFSLDGLGQYPLDSQALIQEIVRRVMSNSSDGHIVISAPTEGARFSAEFSWEPNFNSGDYSGIKTFSMRPGDKLGVVLIPNGTFQQVLNNPTPQSDQQPLFSLVSANPSSIFHAGQIADVTGLGHTFALEDQLVNENSDRDYNDMIFQVLGAVGSTVQLNSVINPSYDWTLSQPGQSLMQSIRSEEERTPNGLGRQSSSTSIQATDAFHSQTGLGSNSGLVNEPNNSYSPERSGSGRPDPALVSLNPFTDLTPGQYQVSSPQVNPPQSITEKPGESAPIIRENAGSTSSFSLDNPFLASSTLSKDRQLDAGIDYQQSQGFPQRRDR
jgi:hypothetical protein